MRWTTLNRLCAVVVGGTGKRRAYSWPARAEKIHPEVHFAGHIVDLVSEGELAHDPHACRSADPARSGRRVRGHQRGRAGRVRHPPPFYRLMRQGREPEVIPLHGVLEDRLVDVEPAAQPGCGRCPASLTREGGPLSLPEPLPPERSEASPWVAIFILSKPGWSPRTPLASDGEGPDQLLERPAVRPGTGIQSGAFRVRFSSHRSLF